jgi:hypothetical protein
VQFTGAAANVSWQLKSVSTGFGEAVLTARYLDSELAPGMHDGTLQLRFSPDGQPPVSALPSAVDAQRTRNSTALDADQLGVHSMGQRTVPAEVFADGFESR